MISHEILYITMHENTCRIHVTLHEFAPGPYLCAILVPSAALGGIPMTCNTATVTWTANGVTISTIIISYTVCCSFLSQWSTIVPVLHLLSFIHYYNNIENGKW